jgi:hypothetical protein
MMHVLTSGRIYDMVGILVHGDNHFIVRGPRPSRENAFALARHWSVIRIGSGTPPSLAAWRISTSEFREHLEWAVIVPGSGIRNAEIGILLSELDARRVRIDDYTAD